VARKSLFIHILLPFLAVILGALVIATWEASRSMRRFHLDQTAAALEVRARIVERQFERKFSAEHTAEVDAACKDFGKLSGTRITVILPSGKVIGDTDEEIGRMDNHADRPEIREAMAGRIGRAMRYSHTLRTNWFYVAKPVYETDKIVGVVRASTSLASVDHALQHVLLRFGLASAGVAIVAALVGFGIARRITGPVKQMVVGTQRFAQGDFDKRLPLPESAELAELATAMNSMAGQLRERIQTVNRQRSELDAVLSSMVEGVLAVDSQERVISLNRAAAGLFGMDPESARGRDMREVVRNPRLQECVTQMLSRFEPFEDEITLTSPAERLLRVSATGLRDEQGREMGALLVFNDVTELRRLERARSDFIANVSHEIRTPVTSIKGYAETLLTEAEKDHETSQRFLEIIAHHADRLAALVEDILSLAGLERSEAAKDIAFERILLRTVIDDAVQVCAPKAAAKGVRLLVTCDPGLEVRANAAMLEQALINLVDNAIKYSEPDGEIRVEAASAPEGVLLSVRDFGVGIAPEHLPRIFERFYRVDRSRSRKLGGTGLGLAIVKHIVALHGGRVTVESALGKGSCFTIHLPAA